MSLQARVEELIATAQAAENEGKVAALAEVQEILLHRDPSLLSPCMGLLLEFWVRTPHAPARDPRLTIQPRSSRLQLRSRR